MPELKPQDGKGLPGRRNSSSIDPEVKSLTTSGGRTAAPHAHRSSLARTVLGGRVTAGSLGAYNSAGKEETRC